MAKNKQMLLEKRTVFILVYEMHLNFVYQIMGLINLRACRFNHIVMRLLTVCAEHMADSLQRHKRRVNQLS